MMRSMYAGVAGLKVHQIKMDVIGNNIANVNTTGYKGSRVTFVDMLSQTLQGAKAPQNNSGGVNPQQVGLGVNVGSIDINHFQGNPQSTGFGNDLAIQGNGYFVVNNGQQDFYTRAGALSLDDYGNLTNATNGYIMQGWMADVNGIIDPDQSMTGIRIPIGETMPGSSTTRTSFQGNLDGRALGGYIKPATIDVFDSLGGKHTMTVEFERQLGARPADEISLAAGTWTMSATADAIAANVNGLKIEFAEDDDDALAATYDATSHTVTVTGDWDDSHIPSHPAITLATLQTRINDALTLASLTNVTLAFTGTFNAADLEGAPTLTLIAAANIWDWRVSDVSGAAPSSIQGRGTITFNSDGTFASQTTDIDITFDPDGTATMPGSIGIDFAKLTQSAAEDTVEYLWRDGYAMGSLASYSINDAGEIVGAFTNGFDMILGQLGIATFNNPYGLIREANTLFSPTQNSGAPQVDTAGTGGRGEIMAGTLEMSNVDLAQQFTEMITAQRGFQANSKIITTSDQMLQELVNLKR